MINEHDLKDWDFDALRTCVTKVAHDKDKGSDDTLREFIEYIGVLAKKNVPKVPAVIDPQFWKWLSDKEQLIKWKDING